MDCEEWPDARRAIFEKANLGFDFFNTDNLITNRISAFGGSVQTIAKRSKISRNDPFPCGSGNKYKNAA